MENKCKDCDNFLKYYILSPSGKFHFADCGYCRKRYMRDEQRVRKSDCDACKDFIQAEDKNDMLKKSIKGILEYISVRLNGILDVLNSDILE